VTLPPASTPRSLQQRYHRVVSQAAVVAAAMAVGNVLSYVLSVSASRRLGPEAFGVLGALLGLIVVGYVVALGLQMVTTRRLATGDTKTGALTRIALVASASLGVVGVLLAVPLTGFLHLDGILPLLLVAATFVPMTWSGFIQGMALGRERFALVGLAVALLSLGKVGGGLVGLALTSQVDGVLWGTAVGTWLGVAAATWFTRRLLTPPSRDGRQEVSREVGHVVHALLAMFVLTNVDVVLARHYLSAHDAGLFAAGAIVAKITFWLPQFITVVALPRLADARRRNPAIKASVAATAAVGAVTTTAAALAGGLVVLVIAGPAYESLSSYVWLFAAEGSAFALAQLLLYARLSREDRTAVVAVWAAVATLVGGVALVAHGSPQGIVVTALAASGGLAVVGLAAWAREHRPGQPRSAGHGPGVNAEL
jgi:O-antigen/teichoic acid export membrane protein